MSNELRDEEIDRLYLDLDSKQAKLKVSEHIIEPKMLIETILSLYARLAAAEKQVEELDTFFPG